MTIYEQFKEILKGKEMQEVKLSEIKEQLHSKFGTNSSSVILADYCYNRYNDGIAFDKHLFEYRGRGKYLYFGESFPYTGFIWHKPFGEKKEKIVGEWIKGQSFLKLQ